MSHCRHHISQSSRHSIGTAQRRRPKRDSNSGVSNVAGCRVDGRLGHLTVQFLARAASSIPFGAFLAPAACSRWRAVRLRLIAQRLQVTTMLRQKRTLNCSCSALLAALHGSPLSRLEYTCRLSVRATPMTCASSPAGPVAQRAPPADPHRTGTNPALWWLGNGCTRTIRLQR